MRKTFGAVLAASAFVTLSVLPALATGFGGHIAPGTQTPFFCEATRGNGNNTEFATSAFVNQLFQGRRLRFIFAEADQLHNNSNPMSDAAGSTITGIDGTVWSCKGGNPSISFAISTNVFTDGTKAQKQTRVQIIGSDENGNPITHIVRMFDLGSTPISGTNYSQVVLTPDTLDMNDDDLSDLCQLNRIYIYLQPTMNSGDLTGSWGNVIITNTQPNFNLQTVGCPLNF